MPIRIDNITSTVVNGEALNIQGYLDIGLYDTMKDLFVNFIGAVVFSIFGFFYVKHRGKKTAFVENIIPQPEEREESLYKTAEGNRYIRCSFCYFYGAIHSFQTKLCLMDSPPSTMMLWPVQNVLVTVRK